MTAPFEDPQTFQRRVGEMAQVVAETREDLVSVALCQFLREDHQPTTDRVYERLERLSRRDLALAVVLALHPEAVKTAQGMWVLIHETTPDDWTEVER